MEVELDGEAGGDPAVTETAPTCADGGRANALDGERKAISVRVGDLEIEASREGLNVEWRFPESTSYLVSGSRIRQLKARTVQFGVPVELHSGSGEP